LVDVVTEHAALIAHFNFSPALNQVLIDCVFLKDPFSAADGSKIEVPATEVPTVSRTETT
jgi:hypothetical protein